MNNSTSERLKLLRTRLGAKTQTEFAEKLGITQTSLSKYENGTVDIPDEVKVKIGKFGINLHWLITGQGEMLLAESPKQPLNLSQKSSDRGPGAVIDQRLEKIEAEIAKIKDRLMRSNTDSPDSGLFVSEPEPEYDMVRVCSVDNVAAGPPIPQSEDLSNYIEVPRRLIKTKPENYYAVHVRGQSMFAAGIPDGCWALIRKSDVPRSGAIQVVRCGGRSTLKRLQEHEDHRWTLNFEDNTNRSIELGPDEDYQIQGDFMAVLPDVK